MRILVIIFGLAASCSGLAGEKIFEQSFEVPSGGILTLATDAGSVVVRGTGTNIVGIRAEVRGKERDVREFEISARKTDKGVEVTGKQPSSWIRLSKGVEVQYTIDVPREYHVRLATSGGDVTVSGLKGSTEGKTSGGNVRASDLEGTLELRTSGGDARAENVKGDVKLRTSGGNIVAHGVKGSATMSTSGGSVTMREIDGAISAKTSGGNIAVHSGGRNAGIDAETSGGDIDLMVLPDITADVDASTSGGEVVCDLPIMMEGNVKETKVKGKINGGGPVIRARSSGGNIHIRSAK